MLRKLLLLLVASVFTVGVFAQSGTLKGSVKDPGTGETIPFANITVEKGGSVLTGGMTDFDGNYTIKPVPPGKYTVKCSYVGYSTKQIDGVVVNSDKITFLNFDMSSGVQLQTVEVFATPLIDPDQVSTGGSVTAEEIKKMPGRSAEAVATTVAGVYSEDGNISSIRGAREEGTVYYIDGVKVRGSTNLPKSAMADVTVITGGVPAKYGDATGGIISISTSGPSNELYGGVEVVTSQFLDPYSYNLIEGVVSGPLIFKTEVDPYDSTKMKRSPIVGFFLSGNFSYTKDPAPRAKGVWVAKDDVLQTLKEDPTRPNPYGLGVLNNGNWLQEESFENVKAHENLDRYQGVFAGKIDYKPSNYVNITIGGSYDYQNGRNYSYNNTMFNSDNNGQYIYNNWRAYARLTQRFADKAPNEEEASASVIKNAFYRVQIDYSKTTNIDQDRNHKDNLFNYGYLGKYTTSKVNSYEFTDTLPGYSTGVWLQNGFRDTSYLFEASDINPTLATYTQSYYDTYYPPNSFYTMNMTSVETFGALLNGQSPTSVYGMYTSPGTPYNDYSKSEATQLRISAAGSADIKDHEISIGFEFEQRSDSYFGAAPQGLWTLARQLTNFHILELDIDNPHPVYDNNGVFQDTVYYDRLYNESSQALFDVKLRESLDIPVNSTEWLDLDSYSPDQLSLEYFSPDELFNGGSSYVTYYGFNHYGEKLKNKPSFAEFFTETDDYGRLKREIAPFEPTYAAGYIQDKFGFNDLVFNVGLRIDRYDANQMVPKDPYVLAETYTAGDQSSIDLAGGTMPVGVQDNWVVYVDDINEPSEIRGYRDGNDWYDKYGAPIDDPNDIATASGIAPYLVDPDAELNESAFEDYKPQITVMPRVSFSFPISDVALFFAHYDVLSNRPTQGYNRMNPISYLFIEANPSSLANPNLKPQKTIDYELGFQQKLNDRSSLKLSAFYREMRDMIQIISITGGYPTDYTTYGNLDFGTVKGFSATYQLRRSGNATIRANYTLQFANGTGSDPNTALNLINQGFPNIRFTNPFDYDQRHNLQLAVDFRFGGVVSARPYNGPNWFGRDILANSGANFTVMAGSGKPYSKRDRDTEYLVGSVNGSRMPWSKTINVRFDRDFKFEMGGDDESKGKEIYLNVYLDILNLLNTANIKFVSTYTGNPDDDGYLSHPKFQSGIRDQIDEQAFRNYYAMFVDYPWNYSRPRTIQLGMSLSF